MKLTETTPEPRQTTFGELKDREYFILCSETQNDRIYRKATQVNSPGVPFNKVEGDFGMLVGDNRQAACIAYQFPHHTDVFKVEIDEIRYHWI